MEALDPRPDRHWSATSDACSCVGRTRDTDEQVDLMIDFTCMPFYPKECMGMCGCGPVLCVEAVQGYPSSVAGSEVYEVHRA